MNKYTRSVADTCVTAPIQYNDVKHKLQLNIFLTTHLVLIHFSLVGVTTWLLWICCDVLVALSRAVLHLVICSLTQVPHELCWEFIIEHIRYIKLGIRDSLLM